MCIMFVEVHAVATEEEKKIIGTSEWNIEHPEFWPVYYKISKEYYTRKEALRLEALRKEQEAELSAKEAELFNVAKSMGLHYSLV